MNIYIEPAIEKILRKEESMSGLINTLLRKHYGYERTKIKAVTFGKGTPGETTKYVEQTIGPEFCKNGHPIPEGRTKCLGKGCKYS